MKIRSIDSNDLGVLACGLRQNIFVRRHQVGYMHILFEGVATRTNDMALKVYGVQISGSDWEHSNSVAVLNLKRLEFLRDVRVSVAFRDVEAEHRLVLV